MAVATVTTSQASDSYKVPNYAVFQEAKDTICKLVSVMDDQEQIACNNRELRYTEIDIEAERKASRLAPDELYIPQHIIDTNIRREQATYISYITQSARSVILADLDNPSAVTDLVEKDFTNKCRYEGWQMPWFREIDGMQQNGYGIMELVFDEPKPGHLALQEVAFGDFGYSLDSKHIQDCEMVTRQYRFTKSQLLAMANPNTWGFNLEEVQKCITVRDGTTDYKDASLYKVEKVMFRLNGVVNVAWSCQVRCNDWLRPPRPLFIGRMTLNPASQQWEKAFETAYPFTFVPYVITENTVLSQHKGRSYMDQDYQEGVSSLMSSFVTAHRRASYFMFSKDSENDPNADVITQSSIIPKHGAVINSKVKQFSLEAPDASMLQAINALATANMQENAQINFAAQNRQDSRKTATEISASQQSSAQLSSIQLSLFSTAVKGIYSSFFEVCRSRIMAKLIVVSDSLLVLYSRNYSVRPAGDVDVIERQRKIAAMQTAWPVMQNTPAAQLFLSKLLQLLFPEDAEQYVALFQQNDAKTAALQSCLGVLTALVRDPNALGPNEQQNVPQIKQLILQLGSILNPQPQQGQQQQNQPQQ